MENPYAKRPGVLGERFAERVSIAWSRGTVSAIEQDGESLKHRRIEAANHWIFHGEKSQSL